VSCEDQIRACRRNDEPGLGHGNVRGDPTTSKITPAFGAFLSSKDYGYRMLPAAIDPLRTLGGSGSGRPFDRAKLHGCGPCFPRCAIGDASKQFCSGPFAPKSVAQ
jgi:hypothetical protein